LRSLARGGVAPVMAARLHASVSRAVARLRQLLLAPLRLPPGEPLVVVPSSLTWQLPWAHLCALPVAVAPSSASWARTLLRRPPEGGGVVLVAGPDLHWSATEVQTLAALHPGAEVLVPPDSTVDAVVTHLRGARLAHLACHGHLRADNPTFSSFLLSRGELTVHELDVQDVAPHRVVLSACDSGADASFDGNELVGFVSALLGRGTAGLLASCVLVSDQEAVPLMREVHGRLVRGDTLADALHTGSQQIDPERPEGLAVRCAFNAYGAA
jgi:CHAT domain